MRPGMPLGRKHFRRSRDAPIYYGKGLLASPFCQRSFDSRIVRPTLVSTLADGRSSAKYQMIGTIGMIQRGDGRGSTRVRRKVGRKILMSQDDFSVAIRFVFAYSKRVLTGAAPAELTGA